MTVISPDEYNLLMSLSGNEQSQQAANIGNKYGLSSAQILALIGVINHSSSDQPINQSLFNSTSHRFEYDPSPTASTRRQQITQAVNCPGCGAALGIPDVRPIKVTCPQCLHEHMFA